MSSQNRYALVVAGGRGERMGSNEPKQFLPLAGKPVLMHTLQAFALLLPPEQIYLVLPADQFTRWKNLCDQYAFHIALNIVAGGSTRYQSVKNGLEAITASEGLVAIHDGVRPLISSTLIESVYTVAAEKGNAIATVTLKDSIRQVAGAENKAVDRKLFQLVQTPQTFRLSLIRQAYLQAAHDQFTDDASLLEQVLQAHIHLVPGDYRNIKITTPEDLLVAESFLKEITY